MVKGPETNPDPNLKPKKGEDPVSAANRKAKQDAIDAEVPSLVNI